MRFKTALVLAVLSLAILAIANTNTTPVPDPCLLVNQIVGAVQ